MKRLFGSIIAALLLLGFNTAGAATFNTIIIDRADGVSEHLQLDPSVVVKFTPKALFFVHPKVTVEYAIDEVTNVRYGNVSMTGIYDGDHQSAIDDVAAPEPDINITADEIRIGGTEPIVVYDLRGVEQARAKSDGTAATLRTSTLPSGVYVVRAGKTTLKVRI